MIAGALAQSFPIKPTRMIVPFTAGSNIDLIARPLGQKLSELWGQPVVIENRPGAGGTLGAGLVAKSQPDGYTLLLNSSAQAINPSIYASLPYHPNDFAEIAALVSQPYVLVVGPVTGLKTLSELLAAAKSKPGQITFGSAGTGSGTHFAAERFRLAAGIDVVHVPYKGGAEATVDTMAGRVTYWFAPMGLRFAVFAKWQAASTGCQQSPALRAIARRSDDRGSRSPRIRGFDLVRDVDTRRHSGRDHEQTEGRYRACARRTRPA